MIQLDHMSDDTRIHTDIINRGPLRTLCEVSISNDMI